MIEDLIDKIRSLPSLPKSFHEINQICSNPDGSIGQLSDVIEKDPMLVANLLKVANSPLYSFRNEIKKVSQAISLFGMATTRALAAEISIRKLLNVDMEPYNISPEQFAEISSIQAALMHEWYRKVDRKKLDFLFLCALLQETGKIIIADEVVKSDEVMQFKSEVETAFNIAEVEKMYVDISSAEVTSEIFEHWGFEDNMVEAIKYSDNYSDAPDEIREYSVALKIVKSAVPVNSPMSERSQNIAMHMVETEGYDTSKFTEAFDIVADRFKL